METPRKRNIALRERRLIDQGESALGRDALPMEAPLTIQITGESIATTMRTPGSDHALVAGFLLAEGFVSSSADLGQMVHCGDVMDQAAQHTLNVSPGPGFAFDLEDARFRRGTLSSSSCGICGREQIEDLMERLRTPAKHHVFDVSQIRQALDLMSEGQPLFAQTGSIHGAALFDEAVSVLAVDEDIGRHNAIDKVVGRALLDENLNYARLLVLSGRISFEVVQKAAAAGVGTIATRKGVSDLAVDLATKASITLCAFVRDSRLSIYGYEPG